MKSATGTIQRTAQLRTVFIDIILLELSKADKHIFKCYYLVGAATDARQVTVSERLVVWHQVVS